MAPLALTPADPDLLSLLVAPRTTPTISPSPSPALAERASLTTIPVIVNANYPGISGSPLPGNTVGITLGSVAAFLILMWLIYTCFNLGGTPPRSTVDDVAIGVETIQRSTRTRSTGESRRRSRSREREVIEVRSPPRPRRERERVRETTVIREESTRRAPPPPDEEDIVEVIEEHSPPPPRRHSRRVSGGYRNVDPDEFAGGDSPMRKVRR